MGLSLSMLRALADDPSLCANSQTTTTQFSEQLKKRTASRQCSYVELLLADDGGNGARDATGGLAVGRATHFVSHAWRYSFRDLVASLEEVVDAEGQRAPSVTPYLWVDCVSVNQHASQAQSFFKSDWWSGIFRKMIGLFEKFVLVRVRSARFT